MRHLEVPVVGASDGDVAGLGVDTAAAEVKSA